jgi:hypothetical protein
MQVNAGRRHPCCRFAPVVSANPLCSLIQYTPLPMFAKAGTSGIGREPDWTDPLSRLRSWESCGPAVTPPAGAEREPFPKSVR